LVKEEAVRIKVYTTKAKFKKLVTIVEGIGASELDKTAKELKTKLACGGSAKEGVVVLQGVHTRKVRDILVKMGYNPKTIDIRA